MICGRKLPSDCKDQSYSSVCCSDAASDRGGDIAGQEGLGPGEGGGDSCIIPSLNLVEYEECIKMHSRGPEGGLEGLNGIVVFLAFPVCVVVGGGGLGDQGKDLRLHYHPHANCLKEKEQIEVGQWPRNTD